MWINLTNKRFFWVFWGKSKFLVFNFQCFSVFSRKAIELTFWLISLMKLLKKKLLILHVNFTINNVIATLTTASGKTVGWHSVRMCGLTGKKRLTPVALTSLTDVISNRLRTFYCDTVSIYLKGINKNKKAIFTALKKKKITVVSIKDRTPVPHNGCKAAKIRRI